MDGRAWLSFLHKLRKVCAFGASRTAMVICEIAQTRPSSFLTSARQTRSCGPGELRWLLLDLTARDRSQQVDERCSAPWRSFPRAASAQPMTIEQTFSTGRDPAGA